MLYHAPARALDVFSWVSYMSLADLVVVGLPSMMERDVLAGARDWYLS